MTAEGASAGLVKSGQALGIVTDRDLRSRVVAAGVSPDEPVSAIMTTPVYTVRADSLGGDVLLDLLDRGLHHAPVLSATGEVLGVVDDGDLLAAEAAGTLEGPEARTLTEAFGFIFSLRLDHQVEQLRLGEVPDDFIDPKALNPLARSYLREAFRAVASVQSGLAAELSLGVRWG
jgi:signal-transduction protein with cAMP-binding, CBS, and nucleotidyltransferase domain